MAVASVWVLIVGLALAAVPLATDPVSPLRLVVLGVGVGLGLWVSAPGVLPRPVILAILVCLGVVLVAAVAGPTPVLSLVGRFPRYEGLPVLAGYGAAVWVGARLLLKGQWRMRHHAVNALVVAALANAVVAGGQLVIDSSQRAVGLVGNATTLGTFGLVALAVVGWQVLSEQRWLWIAGAAAGAACIVMSASRGVLLGAVVACVVAVFVRPPELRVRWWLAPVTALGLVVATLAVPLSASRLTGGSPLAASTVTGRQLLWGESLRLIADHPFLGVGPSRFVDSIGVYHSAEWARDVGAYAPPDSPHSFVMQVAAATGVVGLLALAGLAVVSAVVLVRDRPWDVWQAGVVTLVAGLAVTYSTSFTDPITTTIAALIIGGGLGREAGSLPARGVVVARRAAAVVASVVGVCLGGSALVAESHYSAVLSSSDPLEQAQAAIAVRPWDADLARRMGFTLVRIAEAAGTDASGARVVLEQACPRLPGSVECAQALADAQALSGDGETALATLERAGEFDPFNVDTMLRRGIVLAELGRFPEAERVFVEVTEMSPSTSEPWTDLAQLYTLMGRDEEAAMASARAKKLAQG